MSRAQILQQAGTSVLAQANQSRRTCCLCYVNLFRFIQPREFGAFSFSIDEYIFMECMAVNDISYGREAEIWPRDYSMLARRVQFLRFNDIPVRLVSNNARIITGYIAKFNPKENLILASDKPKGNKRIEVKLESLAILEELSGNDAFNLSLVPADGFNLQQYTPSRRDYFSICNKCYKQGVGIKIYMKYGQVLTGKTTGVNACQVGVRTSNGNHMQVMFDWVSRITSSDYAE